MKRSFAPCPLPRKRVSGLHGHEKPVWPRGRWKEPELVASIGVIASPSQGVSYFEKDGYYARDDAIHREASA